MTNIALYSNHSKVTLPVKSLVEEFKVATARSLMTLRDSKSVEQRNISWSVLWEMESLRISFLWKSTSVQFSSFFSSVQFSSVHLIFIIIKTYIQST